MEGFESFVGIDFWTALFTLCNLIITFLLLRKFLFKPVRKLIDDRQNEIDELYAKADESNAKADALKAEYEDKLQDAIDERDSIIREAKARGLDKEEEIISEAKKEAEKIVAKAQADIVVERERAIKEIRNDISEIAVSIAEKVTEKEINTEDQEHLVSSFIESLGN